MKAIKFVFKVVAGFFIVVFLIIVLIAMAVPSPDEVSTGSEELMSEIENQVAEDAVNQYYIAQRNGTAMDRCVQAGLVAAAWLQAENEPKYQQWKQVEAADCEDAGIPR